MHTKMTETRSKEIVLIPVHSFQLGDTDLEVSICQISIVSVTEVYKEVGSLTPRL